MRVDVGVWRILEVGCNWDVLVSLSGEEDIEDADVVEVDVDEIEVNECVELPLVEREDDEDDEVSDEPEPCRERGRSGVGFNEGLDKRGRG